MRKQFDFEYYKAHPETKVVTRLGSKVSSIKEIDESDQDCIWVTVKFGKRSELSFCSTRNGLSGCDGEKDPLDLFFDIPNPEKKKVPLTHEDLLQRVVENKTMWVSIDNNKDSMFLIGTFDDEGLFSFTGPCSDIHYEHISSLCKYSYYFADGDPCWKEVDRE